MPAQDSSPLLDAIAGGDVAAFEELYDRHSPLLYAVLLRILGNPEDAQETLQDAFVQIWRRSALYDASRGSELAWLISIVRSRGIDRLRSRRVRQERENEAAKDISTHPTNVAPIAMDTVLSNEKGSAIRGALQELPDAQRVALELAYFEGLSQSEIAARLSEPLGTIKTRMQLGMRKLRDRMQRSYGQ